MPGLVSEDIEFARFRTYFDGTRTRKARIVRLILLAMDGFTHLADWANQNEGLLQALAMLGGIIVVVSSLLWKGRGWSRANSPTVSSETQALPSPLDARVSIVVMPLSRFAIENFLVGIR